MSKALIRYCLFLILVGIQPANFCYSQNGYRLDFGGGAGLSNYLGEIGGGAKAGRPFLVDVKLAKSRWNPSAYVRYKFHPLFSAKLAVNYMRIAGDDKLSANPGRKYRNLSFRNDIFDMEATINWILYSSVNPSGIYRRARTYLTVYALTGIGVFYHNPKALYQGSYIPLQPVKTEGVTYSRVGYCVPVGMGVYVSISKKRHKAHRIGLEFNWRYTNTDYLDDVSTTYKNPTELSSSTAIALSNRNVEVTNQPPGFDGNYGWKGVDAKGEPINKAPRGNPNNKDSFLSLTVTYGIAIKSRYTRSKGKKIRTVKF